MPATRPTTDFPLPQELKDEIWRHLDGEVVEQAPDYDYCPDPDPQAEWGDFRPPKLTTTVHRHHTAICRVNKTIGNNASRFLAQRKHVLVRFNCPPLLVHLDLMSVPMVAVRHPERFAHHSFEVNINWSTGSSEYISRAETTNPLEVRVFLEEDMPQFWAVMRLLCQRIRPVQIVVDSHAGMPLLLRGADRPSRGMCHPFVDISACDTQSRTLTAKDLTAFLKSIEHAVGMGYRTFFHGFDKVAPQSLALKSLIASSLVWNRLD